MIPMFKCAINMEGTLAEVRKVLESGFTGDGKQVEDFTNKLKERFGINRLYTTPSATAALQMALRIFNIGHNDKVATTPFTMISTNQSITAVGARPIWLDVDPKTFAVDVDKAIPRFVSDVRAVIITLVGGVPPHNLDRLQKYCKKAKLPFIIDAAHSFDTFYKGKHISHWCDIACFSFQAIKTLSTGSDGGCLSINPDLSAYLDDRAEKLRWFGMSRKVPEGMTRLQWQMKSDAIAHGNKWNFSNYCAAAGLANWDLALSNAQLNRDNAGFYLKELDGIGDIELIKVPDGAVCEFWCFGFLTNRREELSQYLKQAGVETSYMWRRNDAYSAFEPHFVKLDGMDYIQDKIIFIPVGWYVSETDRQMIVDKIKEFYKG